MTDMDCKKIKTMTNIGLYEKIIEMMKDERKSIVLDIAAGEGASSCKLYNLGFDVTSWDINKENFKLQGKISFERCDLNKTITMETKFDYICAIEIVEHIEKPYKLIRDCYSLLEENGELIISTPNITNYKSRLTFLLFGRFNSFFPQDRISSGHINPIPFWELKDILEENRFEMELVTTNGLYFCVVPKYTLKSIFLKYLYMVGLLIVPFIQNWGFKSYKELKIGDFFFCKS